MAYTGMCVTLKDGRTVLYPKCPGWTQAINTLGLAANTSEEQLKVEKPTMTRPTRSMQKQSQKNSMEVDAVFVYKVGLSVLFFLLLLRTNIYLVREQTVSKLLFVPSLWT